MAAWTVIWQMWFDKYLTISECLFQIVVFYSANLHAIDKYIYINICKYSDFFNDTIGCSKW